MKRTIEMILMTLVIILAAAFLGTTMSSCSSDDEDEITFHESTLYAIVMPEGATPIDIMPEDYVLTLNNIIAVNPETGEFKVKNTERIDSVAFPIPTRYVIQFYAEGSLLFEAKLSSVLSSALSSGLTFCYFWSDKNGMARYDLNTNVFIYHDGKEEGNLTKKQQLGIQRMYQILERAGKTSKNIEYDFQL